MKAISQKVMMKKNRNDGSSLFGGAFEKKKVHFPLVYAYICTYVQKHYTVKGGSACQFEHV
jgi:hypothetical protein